VAAFDTFLSGRIWTFGDTYEREGAVMMPARIHIINLHTVEP